MLHDFHTLKLVTVPGEDIAPDVVYAVRSNQWLDRNGYEATVYSRPVIIEPAHTPWSAL